nr:hypothetical protein Iba_chr12bCG17310 [Ipomoea batatas]
METNGKILSSQRSSEDQDQLERSTKKSKVYAGDPGPSAMDIVSETAVDPDGLDSSGDPVVPLSEPLAADVCVNGDPAADDSIALVPETQLEGDAASTVEVPHTSSEEVIENRTEVSEAPLPPINAGVQQRSYLESVVGTETERLGWLTRVLKKESALVQPCLLEKRSGKRSRTAATSSVVIWIVCPFWSCNVQLLESKFSTNHSHIWRGLSSSTALVSIFGSALIRRPSSFAMVVSSSASICSGLSTSSA